MKYQILFLLLINSIILETEKSTTEKKMNFKLYFCLLIYHKTGNTAMEVFQKKIDLTKFDLSKKEKIQKITQNFIIRVLHNCTKKNSLKKQKQLFENINRLVNNEEINILITKYMDFKGTYLENLDENLNSEEKILQNELNEIKKWEQKDIQFLFQKYFRENSHFLSLEERANLFLNDYPVFWGFLVFLLLGSVYGVIKMFCGILEERKRGEKFKSFLEKQKLKKKDVKEKEKNKKNKEKEENEEESEKKEEKKEKKEKIE